MTDKPPCPDCGTPDRVKRLFAGDGPRVVRLRWSCSGCNLLFSGTPLERQERQARKLADRAELDVARAAAAGVLHGDDQP